MFAKVVDPNVLATAPQISWSLATIIRVFCFRHLGVERIKIAIFYKMRVSLAELCLSGLPRKRLGKPSAFHIRLPGQNKHFDFFVALSECIVRIVSEQCRVKNGKA